MKKKEFFSTKEKLKQKKENFSYNKMRKIKMGNKKQQTNTE